MKHTVKPNVADLQYAKLMKFRNKDWSRTSMTIGGDKAIWTKDRGLETKLAFIFYLKSECFCGIILDSEDNHLEGYNINYTESLCEKLTAILRAEIKVFKELNK